MSKADVALYQPITEFKNLGLHNAAASGNIGLVQFALNKGQPIHSCINGCLPIHCAAAGGDLSIIYLLIQRGANVNAPRFPRRFTNDKFRSSSTQPVGTTGSTALHFAVANNHLHIVKFLLFHGANVYSKDKYGVSAMDIAIAKQFTDILYELYHWKIYNPPPFHQPIPYIHTSTPPLSPIKSQRSSFISSPTKFSFGFSSSPTKSSFDLPSPIKSSFELPSPIKSSFGLSSPILSPISPLSLNSPPFKSKSKSKLPSPTSSSMSQLTSAALAPLSLSIIPLSTNFTSHSPISPTSPTSFHSLQPPRIATQRRPSLPMLLEKHLGSAIPLKRSIPDLRKFLRKEKISSTIPSSSSTSETNLLINSLAPPSTPTLTRSQSMNFDHSTKMNRRNHHINHRELSPPRILLTSPKEYSKVPSPKEVLSSPKEVLPSPCVIVHHSDSDSSDFPDHMTGDEDDYQDDEDEDCFGYDGDFYDEEGEDDDEDDDLITPKPTRLRSFTYASTSDNEEVEDDDDNDNDDINTSSHQRQRLDSSSSTLNGTSSSTFSSKDGMDSFSATEYESNASFDDQDIHIHYKRDSQMTIKATKRLGMVA